MARSFATGSLAAEDKVGKDPGARHSRGRRRPRYGRPQHLEDPITLDAIKELLEVTEKSR